MNGSREFRRLFRLPWRSRDHIRDEVDEEIQFHLDMRIEELIRHGLSPDEARRRARGEFGDLDQARSSLRVQDEEVERSRRRAEWLDSLGRDVRFALRSLRKSPGFTGVAALTLGLGIGASTAMFSVLDGVLMSRLPVRDQDRIAVMWAEHPGSGSFHVPVPYREVRAYAEQTRAFEVVGGVDYNGAWPKAMRDGEEPVSIRGTWVTGDFFRALGVVPALGRVLLPVDDVVGADPVMVISHGFWQRHFGGDPAAVGHALRWEDRSYTIVGVMPRGFEYPSGAEFWAPFVPFWPGVLEEAPRPNEVTYLDVVGRLRPGVTVDRARADFDAYLRRTDPQRPEMMRGQSTVIHTLPDLIVGDVRPVLWILAGAVGLVLLIACVNVANLLFIRGSARVQELAVRSALGAGQGRILRQLLTESGVLALLGGALGVLVAVGAVRGLVALAPPGLPRLDTLRIDGRVLAFAAAVTVLTALLAGLAPALWNATTNLGALLRGGTRGGSTSTGIRRVRQALVVGQVALALLVLVGAGLLTRSLVRLQRVEMGFDRERLLFVSPTLPPSKLAGREQQIALLEEMLERVRAVPGVTAVTPVPQRPFSGTGGWDAPYTGDGQLPEAQHSNPIANLEVVAPGYFATLGIPIRRGRGFTEQDREGAPPVAIVSETVARHTWPGEDAVGKRITLGPAGAEGPSYTVVGVVDDTRYRDLLEPRPTLYLPFRQFPGPTPMGLALRTGADTTAVLPAVRAALREVDPDLVLAGAGTLTQLLEGPLARPRFGVVLLGAFAAVALLLAAVGLYGVMAVFVRQRSHEIGVRMALGAQVRDVRALVLRQGLLLATAGVVLGVPAALLGSRAMTGLLFQISPTDPLTLGSVAALLIGVAWMACYVPARRATRVDPMVVLRAE